RHSTMRGRPPPTSTRFPYTTLFRSELGAQPAHVHVDGAGTAEVVIAPHLLQQLRPAQHPPGVLSEELQQLELLERQVERARTELDRKSTRLHSSHVKISYAVFCLKK